jgi:hypothetical protein
MRRQIRMQMGRMAVVFVLLVALVGWNHEFVWHGIRSNIYLNMTIIGTFLFGVILAFRGAYLLKYEIVAYDALREAYDDMKLDKDRRAEDPYWRHHRCLEPGIVFKKPRILGNVFDIVYDEIIRTRGLRISLETMNSLVDGIDTRLSDDRSLLSYITGILVFLGLIGTFIGLMDMVGSVGSIIGGLQGVNGGGGSDQAVVFNKLITDLEAPLVGMATGFSSSLFGLFTSLTLGLISRFASQAANALKISLETWLASASQLQANEEEAGQNVMEGGVDLRDMKRLTAAVVGITRSYGKIKDSFVATEDALRELSDSQRVHTSMLQALKVTLDVMTDTQRGMAINQEKMYERLVFTEDLTRSLTEARDDMTRMNDQSEQRHLESHERFSTAFEKLDKRLGAAIALSEENHGRFAQEMNLSLAKTVDRLNTTLRPVAAFAASEPQDSFRQMSSTIEQSLAVGFARIARGLEQGASADQVFDNIDLHATGTDDVAFVAEPNPESPKPRFDEAPTHAPLFARIRGMLGEQTSRE